MTQTEAMNLALETLERASDSGYSIECDEAIAAIKEALAQPQQEPLEYWNAVEGWVKLEEAREHLDSVGCGTIYKTSGEGRVPLCIAQPQQEPDDLTVWRSRALQAEAVIDKFMAQPKQEPVYKYCDDGKVIFTNPEILSRRPNKEKT